MFNEKNLPTLIILTPIVSILILVSILLYHFVQSQEDYFLKESLKLEKEYILKQKNTLKKEINDVIKYIKYQKNLLLKNTKKNIKIQMSAFLKNIEDKRINKEKYFEYVIQNTNSNTDFMIFDLSENKLIKDKDVFFRFNKKDYYKKF